MLTDCSNTFNTANRMAVLAEAANSLPALTPFVVKRNDERPAPVFFQMNSGDGGRPVRMFFQTDAGERRMIDCSNGVQQGDAMRPALFCMPLVLVLKQIREA